MCVCMYAFVVCVHMYVCMCVMLILCCCFCWSYSSTHNAEYIRKYATEEALCEQNGDAASDRESDISDLSEDEADNMEL